MELRAVSLKQRCGAPPLDLLFYFKICSLQPQPTPTQVRLSGFRRLPHDVSHICRFTFQTLEADFDVYNWQSSPLNVTILRTPTWFPCDARTGATALYRSFDEGECRAFIRHFKLGLSDGVCFIMHIIMLMWINTSVCNAIRPSVWDGTVVRLDSGCVWLRWPCGRLYHGPPLSYSRLIPQLSSRPTCPQTQPCPPLCNISIPLTSD